MPSRVKDKIDRTEYYTTLAQVESSGDPNARAKSSSAAGLYQFIEKTWTGLVKEMGVNYTLDDRFDAQKARKVLDYFTNQNANYLKQKLGREPNQAELYIAHFGGMGTAGKLADLSADSDIREMFGEKAINANKAVFQKNKIENVKQFYDWAATKFDVPQEQRLYKDTEPKPTVKTASAQISEIPQSQQVIDNTATQTVNQNLTNLQNTKENINFAFPFPVYEDDEEEEKDPDSKEVSQAKQILNKRKATRDYLTQIVAQNLAYEPVEYVRTNPYQGQPPQMEDGGKVNITDAEGNTREVSTSSQEYRDWYDSGDIVIQTGEEDYLTDLPAVYLGSGSNSNKETFSEEELSELLRQRTQDELYNRIIIDERSNQQQPKSTIPNTAPTSFKKEEVVEKEGDVISDPEQFLESLKPRDFHRQEVDISVGNITPTEYKNLSEEEKIKFNKKLSEQGIIKLLDTPKGRAETIEVQRKLVEQGYDLGKFGVKGDGVDGVAGRVTTAAIKKYNEELLKQDFSENYSDFKRANVKYEPLFKNGVKEFTVDTDIKNFQSELQQKGLMTKAIHDFDLNFDIDNLGKKELDSKYNFQISDSKVCKYGEECATFVTMDTLNTVGVKAFEDSNVRGDAWTMNDRIVKAGGKTLFSIFSEDKPNLNSKGEITGYMKTMLGNAPEFDTKTLIPGDVVHLYYENSDFTEKAWKESEGDIPTSHVGIVKKGKDGEVYVEHNVGGTLYVNSIDELMEGTRIGSKKALTQVSGISRPKYNIDLEDKKEYYETSSPYSPNFNNLTNIDSPLLKEDAALYSEAIHRNSEVLQQDLGLSETEFRVLSKAAVTIPWQESYYSREIDTPRAAIGNRNVDTLVKKAGAPVRQALGGREMSRGLSQIKDEENLNEVIRENILQNNEANLYEPKKAAIATFYALGSRYLYLRELAAQNNLPITEDELARLSMLSWNESVTTMGKSLKKYGNYDDIMDAYRTDSKTGEIAGHGYDKAFNVFENMFQLK